MDVLTDEELGAGARARERRVMVRPAVVGRCRACSAEATAAMLQSITRAGGLCCRSSYQAAKRSLNTVIFRIVDGKSLGDDEPNTRWAA
jgi:hypothetical protein